MPVIKCPDGRTISGSILGQLNYVLKEATNNHKFGIKVRDILEEGYTKQENPYIRSFKTAKEYYGIWKNLTIYVKREFGINRLDEIRPQHIEAFIKSKANLSPKQLKNISSAIGKLELVLNELFGLSVNYGDEEKRTGRFLANDLASGKKEKWKKESVTGISEGSYADPERLIKNLSDPVHKLVAELQWKTGMTVGEVQSISNSSFHILEKMRHDTFGIYVEEGIIYGIEVVGKNRRGRIVETPKKLWRKVKDFVRKNGGIDFSHTDYLEDIREAALWTEQPYRGSQGFVFSFVNEAREILYKKGYGHYVTLAILKRQLGVKREETVLKYYGR